jgi:flagellar biosynthesis protein FlhG
MALSERAVEQSGASGPQAGAGPVQVVAVTGGKGGVGKTNVCANLGVALARRGHRVVLFDADLGLANVEVLLGLHSPYNLSHVMDGVASLEQTIIDGPAGLRIIPGASGVSRMAGLSRPEQAGLIHAFSELSTPIDFLLVDTAAGITSDVVGFSRAASEVIVVVCDEPASLTDAYALIKVLSREHGVERFHFVANMVASVQDGRRLYEKLSAVTDHFLDVVLAYLGTVPQDEQLRKAVRRQRAVADLYPRSRSGAAFEQLAAGLEGWPLPSISSGHLEFFIERVVRAESRDAE